MKERCKGVKPYHFQKLQLICFPLIYNSYTFDKYCGLNNFFTKKFGLSILMLSYLEPCLMVFIIQKLIQYGQAVLEIFKFEKSSILIGWELYCGQVAVWAFHSMAMIYYSLPSSEEIRKKYQTVLKWISKMLILGWIGQNLTQLGSIWDI